MISQTHTPKTTEPEQLNPIFELELDTEQQTNSHENATAARKPKISDTDGQMLLERFVIGDQDALNQLLEAYSPMIFAVLMRRYRLTQEDADDLYQDILLQLVMKADTIRNVRPWLLGTAFNQARKRIRSLIRDRKLVEIYGEEDISEPADDEDIRDLVTRGLAFAASADQELLRLIYFDDLSYKEVAERLDRPIGSIGPMRGRALARLKTTIDGLEGRSVQSAVHD